METVVKVTNFSKKKQKYVKLLPKKFLIIHQALNNDNNDLFTGNGCFADQRRSNGHLNSMSSNAVSQIDRAYIAVQSTAVEICVNRIQINISHKTNCPTLDTTQLALKW
ncbi:MAG: hypothetical protein LBH49_02145 [Puniceicoccales bacterium]|jgi:hypothetical protein|nr:hypothetical protein [Puniceicoccales bacterium]